MNAIEHFFLGMGFSWTMSKLLPYILFPLIGLLIWSLFRKKMTKRWMKATTLVLLVIIPFAAYFVFAPIYQGDFSNESQPVTVKADLKAVSGNKLMVVTIPDCPYCLESIQRMKAFKERNPKLEIEYVVCSSMPQSTKHYQEVAGNAFKIRLATDMQYMANVADHRFPAFVLTDGKKAVKWSNDTFGVAALDEVESKFN